MRKERTRIAVKMDALLRLLMWETLSGTLPLYLVSEYPRSGGTWLGQMLAAYFRVPFPRNRRPPPRSCVLHGHRLYSPAFRNVFCIIRDGRDVMVSAYYHRLFHSDRNSPRAVEAVRHRLHFEDYSDVKRNLPAFMEYMFEEESRGLFHFRWDEFIRSWIDRDVPIIRYEDLLVDAAGVLERAIQQATGEQPEMERLCRIEEEFSFEKLTERRQGEENAHSFLRKGIANDWKNKFTRKSCEVFDSYAGETLVMLGYEKDRSWIERQALAVATLADA